VAVASVTRTGLGALLLAFAAACGGPEARDTVSIDFEQYELANGLNVILHVDRSDPIAAVAMTFHVGSSREVEGRTGFAHLFEHLFFLDSENLGPGGLDRLMTRVGSSTNGSTNRDRTNYFEVVPVDGLEKTLWAEADKLGFFINTVTESVVDKERQVVKNEKRQGVDNAPYGHTRYVIDRAMYPEGHPYRWQVIGSLGDLDDAELSDVVEFHSRWYGPNNATLVIAGDIDVEQTKAWIDRYFGEIPRADMPARSDPPPVALSEPIRLLHEDNFARLPRLTVAWPGVPTYHSDSYALRALGSILTDGESTPFYEVLVEEEELAPAASATNQGSELAGHFQLAVTAYAETDLDDVYAAAEAAFARFEQEGVPEDELRRVKARYERAFYAGMSSVLNKAFQLAQYDIFAGDPGFAATDLERLLGVTSDDVLRVYDTYVKGRPYIATSFVPRGSSGLALDGSTRAEVVEEPIIQGAEDELATIRRGEERTSSSLDRSVEPGYGEPPTLTAPDVWTGQLSNGLTVFGLEDREVPLVEFRLRIRGGQLLEPPGGGGVANLLAETMTEGTATKTPGELEQAIDMLGASINVSAGAESVSIVGSTLARNYTETMALVEEILLEPRFDLEEFDLARQRVGTTLRQRVASPTALGDDVFRRLLYGDHILAANRLGDLETIDQLTLDDVRSYHAEGLAPGLSTFLVTGAIDRDEVLTSLEGIAERWNGVSPALPAAPAWDEARAGLYFVDVPNAAQSVLRIGYLALAAPDPDFYPATVMNFRLGGGGFASDLTQLLREQRGYTYGIRSGFGGTDLPGPFQITSSVRSNVTYEALDLVQSLVEGHGASFDAEDLEATKSFLLRANARAFETRGAKLGVLGAMSSYGFPADYVLRREQVVRDMSVERIGELADRYLDPERMVWLVVGDARTQLGRLSALGLGDPVVVDREGLQTDGY
jgi:zinc protease